MNVETSSMTGVVRGGGCVVPEDLFMLLKLSEEDTQAKEGRALEAIGGYAEKMKDSLTVIGEENRKRGDEITALKSELCRLNMIHQQELQAAREEASFLKGRVTILEQEMTESARKSDDQMRALIEEKKVAVEAAIKSGETKTLAAIKEADALRREVERLQVEADRQKKLAEADKTVAVLVATETSDAVSVALSQKLREEELAGKKKDEIIAELMSQAEYTKMMFSWYARLGDRTFEQAKRDSGLRACVHGGVMSELRQLVDERIARKFDIEKEKDDAQRLIKIVSQIVKGHPSYSGSCSCILCLTKNDLSEMKSLIEELGVGKPRV